MAGPQELPQLVGEFVDMSKQYLRQETIEPAKQLGRLFGFSFAAGLVLALGAVFLGVAALRLIIDVLPGEPHHRMWSGLGYVLTGLLGVVSLGIVVRMASR